MDIQIGIYRYLIVRFRCHLSTFEKTERDHPGSGKGLKLSTYMTFCGGRSPHYVSDISNRLPRWSLKPEEFVFHAFRKYVHPGWGSDVHTLFS